MNLIKKYLNLAILPMLVVALGIFMCLFFDPFYSKASDPEFIYLINGMNCAIFKFSNIGHFDNPGTPFQVFIGIIIRITHLFSGQGSIVHDVFSRPEHYLNAISISMFLIQAVLVFFVGLTGIRRKIPFWQIVLLQASCFFNDILIWLFCRISPDRFFMIVGLIFILVYLKHGYENRSSKKFALWSGVVMALGLATKFNFLCLLFLPLLFIDSNKNRLIYVGSGMISFFIFISPIIDKFGEFLGFMTKSFTHDGLYGSGESNMLNLHKIMGNLAEIFRLNLELSLLIIALIILTFIAINKRKEGLKDFIFLFAGLLFVILLQIVMVSKHFKNYYLAPVFIIYGFIFFIIAVFLSKIIQKKNHLIIATYLLPLLFILITARLAKNDYNVISEQINHRDKIRSFVDTHISRTDFWFVEPTWETGPYVENALIYGLSYCGHRENYLPELIKVNPNIVTYEDKKEEIKLWRGTSVSLDSVVATGKNIYIYSTPERHASVLIQMVNDVAARNNLQLSVETIYTDNETKNEIIRLKALNSNPNQYVSSVPVNTRQKKIEKFIQSIKDSPEWLEKVKEKAITKHISVDSMILLDAIYMTDNVD